MLSIYTLLFLATVDCPEPEKYRIRQVFDFEFAYAQNLLDWDRVDCLYEEQFKAFRREPNRRANPSLSSEKRALYSLSLRYISKVFSMVPEYSNPILECIGHVKLVDRTEILRWSIWTNKTGVALSGLPFFLDLVFRDKVLVSPSVCIKKTTSVESDNGQLLEFILTVDLDSQNHRQLGKVASREEAILAATEAVKGNALLHRLLNDSRIRKPVTRLCCTEDSIFWIVWFHSVDGSVQYRNSWNAWLSADEEIGFHEDVNQLGECSLRAFPVLVRESGEVCLGIPRTVAVEANSN